MVGDGLTSTVASASTVQHSWLAEQHHFLGRSHHRWQLPMNCTNDSEMYGFHPGGIMTLRADGSVNFLAETTAGRVIVPSSLAMRVT
jgi:hypothetical protein